MLGKMQKYGDPKVYPKTQNPVKKIIPSPSKDRAQWLISPMVWGFSPESTTPITQNSVGYYSLFMPCYNLDGEREGIIVYLSSIQHQT